MLRRHPLARSGHPAMRSGRGRRRAARGRAQACCYPELVRGGPQTLVLLGSEVGTTGTPMNSPGPQLRARPGASQGVPRPFSGARGGDCRLGTALVEHAVNCDAAGSRQTVLGGAWLQPLQPAAGEGPPLDGILHHATLDLEGHSRLPVRRTAKEGAAAAGLSGGSGRSKETSPAGGKRREKKRSFFSYTPSSAGRRSLFA